MTSSKTLRGFILVALAAGLGAGEVQACRMALVLALDVSTSVDDREDRLQREGLANALVASEVAEAILGGPEPVALHAFEWSGQYAQATLLDWALIRTREDLAQAAETIHGSTRGDGDHPTALGAALLRAALAFETAPRCDFRKIDVSGDGANNHAFPPGSAYRAVDFSGITVNGLVIGGEADTAAVVDHYRSEVLRGPGAFLEIADSFEDFERAMRRKLVRELETRAVGHLKSSPPGLEAKER